MRDRFFLICIYSQPEFIQGMKVLQLLLFLVFISPFLSAQSIKKTEVF